MAKLQKNILPIDLEKEAAMGVPHITSFCCCCGLEIGAKIIGFLHFICSLVIVITCCIYVHKFDEVAHTAEDAGDHLYSTWRNITAFITGVSVVHVLLAITLLYGIYKRNTVALRVWVVIMSILWVLSILTILTLMVMYGLSGSGSDIFLNLLYAVIVYGVISYAVLCVYSYYLMLRSCEDMDGPNGKPY